MAYILLVIVAWCWGLNAVLGQLAVDSVSPMMLVVLRWFGVVVLLAIFARRQILGDWVNMKGQLWYIALLGVIGFTGFNSLFYVASHHTSGVNIGILQGSIPIIVMLGALIAYQTSVSALQCIGVVITLIGVAIVTTQGDLGRLAQFEFNRGDLLMLLACVLYAAYTVGLRRAPKVAPLALFAVLAFSALIASIPMALWEYSNGDTQWPSQKGWMVVGLVTLFPSFLAQVFFIQGVNLIGPARAGMFVNLVPVFAALMAVTFLQEPFRPYHGLALALVLVGIGIAEFSKRVTK